MAYKGLKTERFKKLLDKAALHNKELYKKLEDDVKSIIEKYDFQKIKKDNEKVINDVGACALSCLDTAEALEESDCMCISLSITRPEAAIADPSRVRIKDIIPTYLTADSFLEAAQFQINAAAGDEAKAHNAFEKDGEGKITQGIGRENITGVMPLYLFKEHWNIAKRKVQPIFGFMCTLDIMGYSSE